MGHRRLSDPLGSIIPHLPVHETQHSHLRLTHSRPCSSQRCVLHLVDIP
jgi:hypothetical protein